MASRPLATVGARMRLRELFHPELEIAADVAGLEISALALDDREVRPGTLFFCVPGMTRDGHDFAPAAVAAGAAALVVERPLPLDIPQVCVADARAAMAPAAARLAGDPTRTLAMVGITGTSGKTTSAYLTAAVLSPDGPDRPGCGLVGTVATRVAGRERPAIRTTPEAIALQPLLRSMADGGDRACVMEVSSHAIGLHRADAIHWRVVAFTNLGHDHLDFHGTVEEYFAVKRALLQTGAEQGAVLVVCVDDEHGRRLAAGFPQALTVGLDEAAQLRATDLEPGIASTAFSAGGSPFLVPLPGRFNVRNALIAIAAGRALGLGDREIAGRLAGAGGVPGRFEPVDAGQPFAVIVDYAHKPEAVAGVLEAARELAAGHRVCCVIGAGGDRDRDKRPLMAAAAAAGADQVILTSDNPRGEDPGAILDAMATGAPQAERIDDRRRAIAAAFAWAAPRDVVVIAGKGHETHQEFAGGEVRPFDDRVVAREELRALLGR